MSADSTIEYVRVNNAHLLCRLVLYDYNNQKWILMMHIFSEFVQPKIFTQYICVCEFMLLNSWVGMDNLVIVMYWRERTFFVRFETRKSWQNDRIQLHKV